MVNRRFWKKLICKLKGHEYAVPSKGLGATLAFMYSDVPCIRCDYIKPRFTGELVPAKVARVLMEAASYSSIYSLLDEVR